MTLECVATWSYLVNCPETESQFEIHTFFSLQEKYTRVMRDKADLVDKSERLEHIIMQLQGETDTIGKLSFIIFLLFKYPTNREHAHKEEKIE